MRLVSPVVLGLMLAVAGSATVATPAFAAKKEKEPAAPKRNFSKAFVEKAQPLDKAAQAKDYAALAAALGEAQAAATSPDDKYMVGYYVLQLGTGTNDIAKQRDGIKQMLATGTAGPDEAKFNFFAGKLAYDAKDYDDAIPYLQKATDAGYEGSSSPLLLAESYFQKAIVASGGTGQLNAASKPVAQQGLAPLKKAIEVEKAAGKPVPAAWMERGFTIAYVSGSPDAADWSKQNLMANPSGKNWSNLLRTFQDTNKTITRGENLDLLRLMRQTGSFQSEGAYGEYIDIASKSGLLGEVKSVIEEGRAAGKIAPAKFADYYGQANEGIAKDKASLAAGEASAAKAPTGRPAASTADAYLGYKDYAKAISLYRTALQKGSVDAGEVNTRLGIALALSGDAAGAKSAFEQVTTGARKSIAEYWLLWLSTKQAA
ncbi:MAG: hypothetical protein ACO1NM_00015 [Sphingobium phenoxybenzoativorans]|uniref:Tetratricopeptide repeat protein n=1 Tax=Sphingobium phenoxybenzoativorans TaxID=1592790 RepID=A0A975Q3J5_9SPHN|nr:hypothetical protein [Sphingobium phenoxybenzoativorans]QUT07796.1 hypothetical protein KFK14_10665 [Sphingobium phenoxybenzoativorans]